MKIKGVGLTYMETGLTHMETVIKKPSKNRCSISVIKIFEKYI